MPSANTSRPESAHVHPPGGSPNSVLLHFYGSSMTQTGLIKLLVSGSSTSSPTPDPEGQGGDFQLQPSDQVVGVTGNRRPYLDYLEAFQKSPH